MGTIRNATPSLFGYDFQVNAAIMLMLYDIKHLKELRLEGETEDIELYYTDDTIQYAQAKSSTNPDNDTNMRSKLLSAFETLSEADNEGVSGLILATNNKNPFSDSASRGLFYGPPTFRCFDDLPKQTQSKILTTLKSHNYQLDTSKFKILYFQFDTNDNNERYKSVLNNVRDYINEIEVDVSARELLRIWQHDILKNGATFPISLRLTKDDLVWPMIVLELRKKRAEDYLEQYDDGIVDDVLNKYSEFIDFCSERYSVITNILYDFNEYNTEETNVNSRVDSFISERWNDYTSMIGVEAKDELIREILVKTIMHVIINKRRKIATIRRSVGYDY